MAKIFCSFRVIFFSSSFVIVSRVLLISIVHHFIEKRPKSCNFLVPTCWVRKIAAVKKFTGFFLLRWKGWEKGGNPLNEGFESRFSSGTLIIRILGDRAKKFELSKVPIIRIRIIEELGANY